MIDILSHATARKLKRSPNENSWEDKKMLRSTEAGKDNATLTNNAPNALESSCSGVFDNEQIFDSEAQGLMNVVYDGKLKDLSTQMYEMTTDVATQLRSRLATNSLSKDDEEIFLQMISKKKHHSLVIDEVSEKTGRPVDRCRKNVFECK